MWAKFQSWHVTRKYNTRKYLQLQMPTRCETRLSSQPLLFGLYLDALEGRLNDRECDALTLADVHVWLLLFVDDLVLTSESKVGLQQQLDTLQQFCAERGLTVNVKKTKVMVFNYVDPCQKFVLEGDIIERV
jgi:hypothetical protein